MLKSARILLAIASYFDYEICQMDIKTALLNEQPSQDVYKTQPEGFVDPKNSGKIYKLHMSIWNSF